jgi:NADPH-dependent 2,4-dienoyl-CoA reductase/sulfur reductase-like enzyme/nitrite reductase/ring-hydroxylating ferredoxin subunit
MEHLEEMHAMNDSLHNLGNVSDFASGEMRQIEVSGEKILLLREGDEVWAVGGECPHAGAPLIEGVLTDRKVICPWHKAVFCIRTGALIDPPAVDGIQRYRTRIVDGNILLEEADSGAKNAMPAAKDARHFVILGAGAAGLSAAQSLREEGFSGKITLVSREEALPYDRTILSKYVLAGQEASEKSPLHDAAFYEGQKIDRYIGEISNLDASNKIVEFSTGDRLQYDAAVIATGSVVVPLPFPGGTLGNVFGLRTQDDAERIVSAAKIGKRVVVIGASFIGMEVAAALRERGLGVIVVTGERAPFEKQLGADVGNVYRELHQEKGVEFRFGAQVEHLEGEQVVKAVLLSNGERLDADIVVAGIGVRPATGFAKGMAREKDQGLEVDAQLRLRQDLFAVGDVAAFPSYGDGPLIRAEHWRVAEQQGRMAARNMLGREEAFTAVPYFWTSQFSIRLDYVGHARGDAVTVIRGDLAERAFIVYYLEGGLVAAAAGMNRDKDMAALITLLSLKRSWKVDELHPIGASPEAVLNNTAMKSSKGGYSALCASLGQIARL